MARYITIGGEFINLDKICHIQVYSSSTNEVIVEVEYDHSVRTIPCAGSEEEVWTQLKEVIRYASKSFCSGPMRAV
jgi:hypothetical protein